MSWSALELQSMDLGDVRLNRRAVKIADTLGLAPGRTIPQAFQSWASTKACYNFFNNSLVSERKIIAPHIAQTTLRMKEHPVVLLVNDTSELDYNSKDAMKGKERIMQRRTGLWLHPTIAVTPQRLMLGVVDGNFWKRKPISEKTNRNKTAIEDKESYRWLQSYRRSCDIAKEMPEVQLINISDREGDIIEIFDEVTKQRERGTSAEIIVRSQHDRLLRKDNKKEQAKLRQSLKEAASLGEIEFINLSFGFI